jgi:hypothetical protein
MANSRIGGVIAFKIGGEQYSAKGSFSYNIGVPKKEMVVGSDAVHGFKETPQVPYIEGAITDNDGLDLEALQRLRDVTVTCDLANGKTVSIEQSVYAADGVVTTEEGEIEIRFEGVSGREIAGDAG